MKRLFNIKLVKFYLWTGLAFLLLNICNELINNSDTFFKRTWNNVWLTSYLVVINFILFEVTLPYIKLTWDRLLLAPLLLLMHLALYSIGLFEWRYIGIQMHLYFPLKIFPSLMKGVYSNFPYAISSIFFFGVIRHVNNYRKLKAAAQQLRIEKQEAELNYLKSQTNPHFLFNTLNNIYSLARDKSDRAPESILRLSKLLRFMLYETGGDYITIEQELKVIGDYIELEKLRYDDSFRVDFDHTIEDMKQALPPLLLIPLVENAFKHGVSETRHEPFVDIGLLVNKQQLTFIVKNSTEQGAGDEGIKENIGLSNLRRQLQLLYTDHTLTVQQGATVFTAILKINLASHV